MSRTSAHKSAKPTAATATKVGRQGKLAHDPKTTKDQKPRWQVVVNATADHATQNAANTEAAPDHQAPEHLPTNHLPADRLRQAALMAGARPTALPHRATLETLFAVNLTGVEVLSGRGVDAALDAKGADAAAQDGTILLHKDAPLPVVAHEVAHVLQWRGFRPVDATFAEAEARHVESLVAAGQPIAPLQAGLATGATAFRMPLAENGPSLDEAALPAPNAPVAFRDAANGTTPQATSQAPSPAPFQTQPPASAAAQTGGKAGAAAPTSSQPQGATTDTAAPDGSAAAAGEPGAPTFEPAPMPDLGIDTQAAAAQTAAAEAALDNAQDTNAVLKAFQDAPPSLKAREAGQIDRRTAEAASSEQTSFNDAMPEFEANMSGTDDLPAPAAVAAPQGEALALEDGTPAPAPEPVVDPTPDPGTAAANAGVSDFLARFFGVGDAASLGRSFDQVDTSDTSVDTSAGTRPSVPQEGDTDPARVSEQKTAALDQSATHQTKAAQAVVDGPGPEQAQLRAMQESYTPAPVADPVLAEPQPAPEGADAFAAKPLDAETVAIFDQYHAEPMRASLEGAQAEADQAVSARNTGRDAELSKAETEQTRLNAKADTAQRDEVTARRQDIQTARQTAVDDQATRVADVKTEAETAHTDAKTEIDTQVSNTETQVSQSFDKAETDAQTEVDKGHTDADAEREASEKEAENASWWDRAVDWVADQFKKLAAAINSIFDAVRSAVKGIINAVKDAALKLIDLAASAIKSAIKVFGEILKAAVNALLSEYFPEIAKALNDAIDSAVVAASKAVDVIADGLKAGISMLLDALAAGLDAILAAYQAAVNAALTLVQAALTGDWAAIARLILTPILNLLGIDPEAFFQMLARAAEALDIIIDDPIGFLSNLIDTVKGGIGLFADNFPRHLLVGILMWLTGPLGAGIIMPQQFDLWGLLDIARQVFGLTLDMVRKVATRVLGPSAVAVIDFVMKYVTALITGGWRGLWDQLMADLGTIRDIVLDQIKSFLVEKVVMAAITWLASLFSPVGALVKLVLTIWNFIQFLRTQLARILQVVQTVINTIWEIATGALEGPMRGVETVLGQLIPVVLDLLARLLGVTGVPEKVQSILQVVRTRIETGLENLMRKVAATAGVATTPADGAAPAEIMAPLQVSGGGETHTLFIEDQGETVVPMIRSAPTPLSEWLDQRLGQPFTDLGAKRRWKDETTAKKKAELQALIAEAKADEQALDQKAERAEDSVTDAAKSTATPAQKSSASKDAEAVKSAGQTTKSALDRILDFFGIKAEDLKEKYADDLNRLHDAVKSDLLATILPRLDDRLYATMDWPQASQMILSEAVLPQHWKQPAMRRTGGGGLAQRCDWDGYLAAVRRIVAAKEGTPDLKDDPGDARLFDLMDRRITPALNSGNAPQLMLAALLAPLKIARGAAAAEAVSSKIAEAAVTGGTEWDFAFNAVTGAYFKTVLVPGLSEQVKQPGWAAYFDDDADNATGKTNGQPRSLGTFLKLDSTGKTASRRAARNGQRLADAVRGADPGKHEWVASRLAAAVVQKAASAVGRGSIDELVGLCELIQFQHEVRTPTEKLIFDPKAPYPSAKVIIAYQSYPHRLSEQYAKTAEKELPQDLRAKWYPAGGPQQGDRIEILQGHPGAVYARVGDVTPTPDVKPQSAGHGTWDRDLAAKISTELEDGTVLFNEMQKIGTDILSFYSQTIWRGTDLPQGGAAAIAYDEYFSSGGSRVSLDYLKTTYREKYQAAYDELSKEITQVRVK
ncbi:MAG: eCIS core domain-containing protein [Cypionkella sp.]